MRVASSVLSTAAETVTRILKVALPARHYALGLRLVCLVGIMATIGCGQKSDLRSEAVAVVEQPAQEHTASEPAESAPAEVNLLVPDKIAIPDLDNEEKRKGKGIPESAIILDLGGTVRSYAANLPFPVVMENGKSVILLGQEDSKLWVSAKFFDSAGQMVCEIERNKLQTNQKDAFRIEQTPHALTVSDNEAKKVFAIQFLNDHAVRLFGDFYSPAGCHVVINERGVEFGHGRSLSSTGLNGVSLVLDPPREDVAQSPPPPPAEHGNDDLPKAADSAVGGDASAGDVGAAMDQAAQAFLASLQPDELAKVRMKFDDPQRLDWTNIPKKQRKGLPIREMTPEQKTLCHNLLRAALSRSGYDKAVKIMSLENNLREGEKNLNTGWARNPEDYFLTIFGEPGASDAWGWSFEGHHLSLNFVIRNGEVVSETPSFWGANPATLHIYVPGGPEEGTRTLASEEQLAFDLVGELDDRSALGP